MSQPRAPINLLEDDMPQTQAAPQRAPVNLLADEMPAKEEKEKFSKSYLMYLPRMIKDLGDAAFERMKSIPSNIQKAQTEIPGLMDLVNEHPELAAKQVGAGLAEQGYNAFNLPHDIANYATKRLHLFPEDINEKIQMARMPEDTHEIINQRFGEPKLPGEGLARGLAEHSQDIVGGAGLASALNPMKLTSGNIVNDVMRARRINKEKYSGNKGLYNQLESEAQARGVDLSNIDFNKIDSAKINLPSLETLKNTRSLTQAQKAISDLNFSERFLEGKQQGAGLDSVQRDRLAAIKDAKKYIQGNMFKDKQGRLHADLLKKHQQIQEGYAKEVVPYTKNKAINEYMRGNKLADELLPSLMKGKFPAKVGSSHQPLMLRRALAKHPYFYGSLGVGGGAGLGALLYKALSGENHNP